MFQFLGFGYQMSIRVHSASTVQVLAIHGRIVNVTVGDFACDTVHCQWRVLDNAIVVVTGQEVKEAAEVRGYRI